LRSKRETALRSGHLTGLHRYWVPASISMPAMMSTGCIVSPVRLKVETGTGELKILEPNQAVNVSGKGETEVQTGIRSQHAIAWTNNRFIYTAAPLNEVFTEMERQFDITIEIAPGIEGEYTGNFMRGESPETILRMIARPFGLTVEQIHQTKYRITKGEN
jgi:transmembrane sensor